MGISKANATWQGDIKTGKGSMKGAHTSEVGFSLGSRFEGQPNSNPEELIGAALAGCFSMALTLALEQAGAKPQDVQTSAEVKLDRDGAGFTITQIALTTQARASSIDAATFAKVADVTKKNCPVSKALAGTTIVLKAMLVPG